MLRTFMKSGNTMASTIAMEFTKGETLAARMKRQLLASEELIDLAIQALDALQEAHTKGIVHRDIKTCKCYYRFAN